MQGRQQTPGANNYVTPNGPQNGLVWGVTMALGVTEVPVVRGINFRSVLGLVEKTLIMSVFK